MNPQGGISSSWQTVPARLAEFRTDPVSEAFTTQLRVRGWSQLMGKDLCCFAIMPTPGCVNVWLIQRVTVH